jgi:hypothetical protein
MQQFILLHFLDIIISFCTRPFSAALKNFHGFHSIAHFQQNIVHVGGACTVVASCQYPRGETHAEKSA